jgi:hypothetical protein
VRRYATAPGVRCVGDGPTARAVVAAAEGARCCRSCLRVCRRGLWHLARRLDRPARGDDRLRGTELPSIRPRRAPPSYVDGHRLLFRRRGEESRTVHLQFMAGTARRADTSTSRREEVGALRQSTEGRLSVVDEVLRAQARHRRSWRAGLAAVMLLTVFAGLWLGPGRPPGARVAPTGAATGFIQPRCMCPTEIFRGHPGPGGHHQPAAGALDQQRR